MEEREYIVATSSALTSEYPWALGNVVREWEVLFRNFQQSWRRKIIQIPRQNLRRFKCVDLRLILIPNRPKTVTLIHCLVTIRSLCSLRRGPF